VHEHLQLARHQEVIGMSTYLMDLCRSLEDAMRELRPVTVSATVDRITMRPEHALSVGLITNELVTNAYKYAFTDGRIGHVDVRLAQANGKVELSVADNGVGCPEKPPCSAKTASS
jgi:two-component sensor histidine kinase